jgi:uncharacterized membrane protein YkoI
MRLAAALLALVALPLAAVPADAQGRGRGRDQDAAFHARQQGQILPLNVILARVRVRNAQYIGADLDDSGSVYRLTFMGPGGQVVRVHVDARTGRALEVSR